MQKEIAGKTIEMNDQGFMTNPNEWSREVAEALATELGINLTDAHWKVIDYIRAEHAKGVELTIRGVGTSGATDIKTFYTLFRGGPLKNVCRIAGLLKPTSCL